jgi:hypothetical protein
MNCKPNQLAMVKCASRCEPCSARVVGVPVQVLRLVDPVMPLDVLQHALEGPVWELAAPLHCPSGEAGCQGIRVMPDACLRPFDPDQTR